MNLEQIMKKYGLVVALCMMAVLMVMPTPVGLTIIGQRVLAVFAFSVIVWMTECMSYPVSAILIVALLTFSMGMAPDLSGSGATFSTSKALTMALSGFSSNALALVGCALFIAVAMMQTGLAKRIALLVLSKIGTRTNRIIAGVIFVGFIMSFLIPSTTARVSCMIPIVMGIILAFDIDRKSHFSKDLILAVTLGDAIWNVGIKTAAAQNMIAIGIIDKELNVTIGWLQWFEATIPYMVVMPVVLYFLLINLMPPEMKDIRGGTAAVLQAKRELGPMKVAEKKLLVLMVILLFFWCSENVLHHFDTSSTTVLAVGIMLLPKIGVINWRNAQENISWGTMLLFGTGISLGTVLLKTKVANWMANFVVLGFGLPSLSSFVILAILGGFLIILHLGFASSTAMSATMIPIIISVLQESSISGMNILGMTLILQFLISFDMILPANGPQNMVAYSTGTFEVADFIKIGLPMTIIGYLFILLLIATYWNWLGMV